MDAAAIERFSGPVLAERAFVSEQAQACVVRPGTDDLRTLVLRDVAVSTREDLAWDAWRRPDGRWTVVVSAGDSEPLSTWVYDPRSRSVQPDDTASHRLASADVVIPLRSATSTVTIERKDSQAPATSQPKRPQPVNAVEAADVVEPVDAGQPGSAEEAAADQPAGEPADESPAPSRSKSRKGRRASVPRWDEILFGAGQSDA